jgi:hypothetical protein
MSGACTHLMEVPLFSALSHNCGRQVFTTGQLLTRTWCRNLHTYQNSEYHGSRCREAVYWWCGGVSSCEEAFLAFFSCSQSGEGDVACQVAKGDLAGALVGRSRRQIKLAKGWHDNLACGLKRRRKPPVSAAIFLKTCLAM